MHFRNYNTISHPFNKAKDSTTFSISLTFQAGFLPNCGTKSQKATWYSLLTARLMSLFRYKSRFISISYWRFLRQYAFLFSKNSESFSDGDTTTKQNTILIYAFAPAGRLFCLSAHPTCRFALRRGCVQAVPSGRGLVFSLYAFPIYWCRSFLHYTLGLKVQKRLARDRA